VEEKATNTKKTKKTTRIDATTLAVVVASRPSILLFPKKKNKMKNTKKSSLFSLYIHSAREMSMYMYIYKLSLSLCRAANGEKNTSAKSLEKAIKKANSTNNLQKSEKKREREKEREREKRFASRQRDTHFFFFCFFSLCLCSRIWPFGHLAIWAFGHLGIFADRYTRSGKTQAEAPLKKNIYNKLSLSFSFVLFDCL